MRGVCNFGVGLARLAERKADTPLKKKYPTNVCFGPRVPILGRQDGQSICYLGTWILREMGMLIDRKTDTGTQTDIPTDQQTDEAYPVTDVEANSYCLD